MVAPRARHKPFSESTEQACGSVCRVPLMAGAATGLAGVEDACQREKMLNIFRVSLSQTCVCVQSEARHLQDVLHTVPVSCLTPLGRIQER